MADNLSVPANSGSAATTASAIKGNNPSPFGAAILGSGSITDALTTGDLTAGSDGEMGTATEFAVEFWLAIEGVMPGADNSLVTGPESNSAGVKQWAVVLLAAGALQFNVRDDAGVTRTATGATSLSLTSTPTNTGYGNWFHIVCTAQGGNLNIYINTILDGTSATWGSHSVRAIGATAGNEDLRVVGPVNAGTNFYFDELAIYRTGLTSTRVLEHYNAGVNRGFLQQLPGPRISAVLDAVSSLAPRSIQPGTRSVIPRYMSGQAPLGEIQRAVEAEDVDAAFFCARDGKLIFLADGHRSSSPYNTSQATFGMGGGAELPYTGLSVDYSDSYIVNEWNVTRSAFGPTSAVTQTASDATSISRYLKRSQSISDVPTTSDGNCSTIATELVAKYKDPLQRVKSIQPKMADAETAFQVFKRDLMDQITVKWTPPGGGSPVTQNVWIQKIEHSFSPGVPVQTTLAVSPL